jgi:hypothetical protein
MINKLNYLVAWAMAINVAFNIFTGNYTASIGWLCAFIGHYRIYKYMKDEN